LKIWIIYSRFLASPDKPIPKSRISPENLIYQSPRLRHGDSGGSKEMRKLLTIAAVSLFTIAVALPSAARQQDSSMSQGNDDWYSSTVQRQADQAASILAAINPSQEQLALAETEPGSMASNAGGENNENNDNNVTQGEDTFNQGVQQQFAENRLLEAANRI
jgi:hypothetical protein